MALGSYTLGRTRRDEDLEISPAETKYTPRRVNWAKTGPGILDDEDLVRELAWGHHPMTINIPTVEGFDPKRVSVAVDGAAMTYRVRSPNEHVHSRNPLTRQVKRAVGSGWTNIDALHAMSFVVKRGESVGVIGTNGSGKSTLMKLLTGKIRPTQGEVYATSTPVMLGVNAALVKQITGRENIRLGCLAMGLSPAQAAAKYDMIVELSGLSEALEMPLKTYSSGMASRLQFAIATAVDPDILLIDEALNTGDAQFRARTKRRLDQVREQAGCVFLVSHSLSTIKQMCTRVLWIEQGQLLADGDPEWVTDQYREYTDHQSNNRWRSAQVVYARTLQELNQVNVTFSDGSRPRKYQARSN